MATKKVTPKNPAAKPAAKTPAKADDKAANRTSSRKTSGIPPRLIGLCVCAGPGSGGSRASSRPV